VCVLVTSCDYSTIKKENEELKNQLSKLEQVETERQTMEMQRQYLESIKRYAVVVTTYNNLMSVSHSHITGEYTPKYKVNK
jgi:cell shape-determining protein MreC